MAGAACDYHVKEPDHSSVENLTKTPLTTSDSENENVNVLVPKSSETEQSDEPHQSSSNSKTDVLDELTQSCTNSEQETSDGQDRSNPEQETPNGQDQSNSEQKAPNREDQSNLEQETSNEQDQFNSNLKVDISGKDHSDCNADINAGCKSGQSTSNEKSEPAREMTVSHTNAKLQSADRADIVSPTLREKKFDGSGENVSKLDAEVCLSPDTQLDDDTNQPVSGLEEKALNKTSIDPNPWCDLCYDEALKKIEACGFCPDCNSFVCKPCLNAHKKSPASRSHLIRQGARMPKSQSDKPIKFIECHVHNQNVKSKFCLQHRKMACSDCVKESHHNCKTTSIYNVYKEFGRRDVIQIKETTNHILKAAIKSKDAVEDNISGIQNQKKVMIKSAQRFHDNLIAKTEEIYSEMIVEINDVCDKKSADLSGRALELSDSVINYEDIVSNIDKIPDKTVDINSFIQLQCIVEAAGVSENAIESINKNFNKVELSFSLNPAVSTFLSECKVLGNVEEKGVQTEDAENFETKTSPKKSEAKDVNTLHESSQQDSAVQQPSSSGAAKNSASKTTENKKEVKPQKQYHLVGKPLSATVAEDGKPCEIGGMDVTSDGKLIVSDYTNQAVKVFSLEGKLLSSVLLAASVMKGVLVFNDTTAVVSSYDGELFVIDISDPYSAYVRRSIHLGYWALSMTRCNDSIVLTKWTEPKSVNMIDMDGHELWSVSVDHNGQRLFQKPHSVTTTIINDKITVVVSDWAEHAIMLIDASNGELIRKVDVKGKDPHGLTADCDGNVYVCDQTSKKLQVFSAEFNRSKAVMSGKDLPSYPVHIAYNDNLNELLVAYTHSDRIDRIHIP